MDVSVTRNNEAGCEVDNQIRKYHEVDDQIESRDSLYNSVMDWLNNADYGSNDESSSSDSNFIPSSPPGSSDDYDSVDDISDHHSSDDSPSSPSSSDDSDHDDPDDNDDIPIHLRLHSNRDDVKKI